MVHRTNCKTLKKCPACEFSFPSRWIFMPRSRLPTADISCVTTPPAAPKYLCSVCPGRHTMLDFDRHSKSEAHKASVDRFLRKTQAEDAFRRQFTNPDHEPRTPPIEDRMQWEDVQMYEGDEQLPHPLSPLRLLRMLKDTPEEPEDMEAIDFHRLRQAFEALEHEKADDGWEDQALDEAALDAELASVQAQDSIAWFPFKKKEHLVALLIIGSTRGLLSRSQYQRIRLGLELSERTSLAGNPLFGLKIKTIITSEMANPMVRPHLVTVPELTTDGPINRLSQCQKWREGYSPELRLQMVSCKNIHYYIYEPVQLLAEQLWVPVFFFQHNGCLKAKCLPAMVEPDDDDLQYFKVTIPEDRNPKFDSNTMTTINCNEFWRSFQEIPVVEGVLLKDVCRGFLYYANDLSTPAYPIENRWRAKAAGKVIRHIPITLYSDDTSGNVSKKYDRHMSIYFTLSGLPPSLTNQEYNIHFLATSNCATALELLDEVVDDLNDLSENGCVTYDHAIGEDVLTMVVPLCHLGDSPMHAELTNTMNPANTLSPCRVCQLQVKRQGDKESSEFVRDFLFLDHQGKNRSLPSRNWSETYQRTRELWSTAQKCTSVKKLEDLGRQYGIRDTAADFFFKKIQIARKTKTISEVDELCDQLNNEFGNRLYNPMLRLKGFDGHCDTPVEILHVVLLGIAKYLFRDAMKSIGSLKAGSKNYNDISGRWLSFSTKGLKVPPIQPNTLITFYQSLVGKEFRTVLQTVPFVLFEHLTQDQRYMWTSLCLLSSYVFQTEISNLDVYLRELDLVISSFLKQLVSLNARWVNKPKFHMLVHLQQSIRTYGPASLFATEKLESFNGKLRDASVHSNSLSPGRDIGNTFITGQMLRIFISASSFFDNDLQARVFPGPSLRELLSTVPELLQVFGLNRDVECQGKYVVGGPAPTCLPSPSNDRGYQQFASISLPTGQTVENDDFLILTNQTIGRVISLWRPFGMDDTKTLLVIKKCMHGRLVPFYSMREILVTDVTLSARVKDIICLLNVQHNCHEGQCPVDKLHVRLIERKTSSKAVYGIKHNPSNNYILNSASHYSGEIHRVESQYNYQPVTPTDWNLAISQGLAIWATETKSKQKTGRQATH
ncbi:hypothetical protein DFH28DRAFT_1221255 [Melampsora americana]|nr:hypothetical protein DFH28DRAFT_1221255 [Melampsora americana]